MRNRPRAAAFAAPRINVWDWRYYQNQLKKQKFAVDAEALRNFFPFQKVLDGMFAIYQRIFGLKFEQIAVPYKWIDDLQLWAVSDAASGEPLGLFYLDMFPRDGKYNHFAEFEIIGGKASAGWKISAADGDIALQLSARDRGQTVALKPLRSRNLVPRVWSRPAYHYDARQVWALCRHPRSDRFRRGSLTNAAKLGLG
jgi:hypothetical protein